MAVGTAAVVTVLLGGTATVTQVFTASRQPSGPSAGGSSGLTVRLELDRHQADREPSGWDADRRVLTYTTGPAYSGSCPPSATATVSGAGAVTLSLHAYDGRDDCTADLAAYVVTIEGLVQAPASLAVTTDGRTGTLAVTDLVEPCVSPGSTCSEATLNRGSQPR